MTVSVGDDMPYIKEEDKVTLRHNPPHTPGELNYIITKTLLEYISYNGLDYQHINDVLGALEGAKLEFYRRMAVPYEKKKIKQNGDVY